MSDMNDETRTDPTTGELTPSEAGTITKAGATDLNHIPALVQHLLQSGATPDALGAKLRQVRADSYASDRQVVLRGSAASQRLLDRSLSSMTAGPAAALKEDLPRLRQQMRDLESGGGGAIRRLGRALRKLPFVGRAEREVMTHQTGEQQLRDIEARIMAARDQLARDQRDLAEESERLGGDIDNLRARVAEKEAAIASVRASLNSPEGRALSPEWRAVLEKELLIPLTQQATDLRTSLTVAQQAVEMGRTIGSNGDDLIVAVDRVTTTVLPALRVQLGLAGALDTQLKTATALSAITEAGEGYMKKNAAQLGQATVQIGRLTRGATLNVTTLAEIDRAIQDAQDLLAGEQGRALPDLQRSLEGLRALNAGAEAREAQARAGEDLRRQLGGG